jgi:NAD(P)-dependent dehydrogenase (short-subunit alcohol dehydrogenase family)
MIRLDDRSLVIVGGGSGLGWAAAELAVGLGAKVTVVDVNPASSSLVAPLGAAARFAVADAMDPDAIERVLADAATAQNGLDSVFVTVGGARLGPLAAMDLEAWKAEIDFNLTSAYVVCRAALPKLKTSGRGAIVTTSSGYGSMPGPDRVAYTAAKAGVMAFTRSFAAVAAADRVRVNCIAPGPIDTPRFRAMNGGDAGVERVRRNMPLGTIPQPVEIARVAIFLLSDAASQITGQVIHVNGGLLMP